MPLVGVLRLSWCAISSVCFAGGCLAAFLGVWDFIGVRLCFWRLLCAVPGPFPGDWRFFACVFVFVLRRFLAAGGLFGLRFLCFCERLFCAAVGGLIGVRFRFSAFVLRGFQAVSGRLAG